MLSKELKDVLKIQKKKVEREIEVKDKLYKQLMAKIKTYAKQALTRCIYTVPNFVYGYSPFNIDEMKEYLIKKLVNDGFRAYLTQNGYIFISWDIKDITIAQTQR